MLFEVFLRVREERRRQGRGLVARGRASGQTLEDETVAVYGSAKGRVVGCSLSERVCFAEQEARLVVVSFLKRTAECSDDLATLCHDLVHWGDRMRFLRGAGSFSTCVHAAWVEASFSVRARRPFLAVRSRGLVLVEGDPPSGDCGDGRNEHESDGDGPLLGHGTSISQLTDCSKSSSSRRTHGV